MFTHANLSHYTLSNANNSTSNSIDFAHPWNASHTFIQRQIRSQSHTTPTTIWILRRTCRILTYIIHIIHSAVYLCARYWPRTNSCTTHQARKRNPTWAIRAETLTHPSDYANTAFAHEFLHFHTPTNTHTAHTRGLKCSDYQGTYPKRGHVPDTLASQAIANLLTFPPHGRFSSFWIVAFQASLM